MSDSRSLSRRELLRRSALTAGSVAALGLPAAAQTPAMRRPGTPPAAPTPPTDITDKKIEDVVKGFDKLDGVVTLYRKKNDLYAEVRADQMGQPMLLQATRSTGTAGAGGTVGDPLADTLFVFKKDNDQIYLVEPNLGFRAAAKTPEDVSITRSFAAGYLGAFKIEAIRPDPKKSKEIDALKDPKQKADALDKAAVAYLIHIPTLFLGDALGFTADMVGYTIDADKTFLKSVKVFPDNLVVTAMYHFAGRASGFSFGGSTLPDDRSIPEQIVFNLFSLKDSGYKARFADDRIGYFTEDYQTFDDDTSTDNKRRMIQRWDLRKKDPKAAVSEPVKPIKFWVDNATPVRYRKAIQDGVTAWNPVFEKLGYKNAVICEIMPDDADWDHADMRHNVVRWMSSPGAGYAVAQFRHNPVTGEIVNSSISIDASWARITNLEYPIVTVNGQSVEGMAPKDAANLLVNPKAEAVPLNRCTCQMGMGMMQMAAFGWDAVELLDAPGLGTAEKLTLADYTNLQLRHVIMHEMGHCLGLRHNFKGSTMLTPAQLQDKTMTEKYGIMASVMDYAGPNLAPLGGKQADYFQPKPGPYDEWAIAYGYTEFPVGGETPGLLAIASRDREFGHDYASDENADNIDPTITRYDLSSDPLAYRLALVGKARKMLDTIEFKYPKPGQSYYELTRVFSRVLGQFNSNSLAVARFVGGIVTERNHFGDKDAVLPVQPVPYADQRRALKTLCSYVFADNALRFSPTLLAKLQMNPTPSNFGFGSSQDLSLINSVANVQATGIYSILNAGTMGRLETNEYRAPQNALGVLETIQTVTNAVWENIGSAKGQSIPPLRRRLQRTYVDAMLDLAKPTQPGDGSSFAQATLRTLVARLQKAEAQPHDATTAAHLAETRQRITRFLHAQVIA